MRRGFIAVIDSGIGGISLLDKLIKLLPNEHFLYFGDNENAPYGNKSLDQLLKITKNNIDYVKSFGVKLLALGCNTLSTTLKNEIEEYAKIPVFGVYPPVDKLNGEKAVLLATKRTAEKYVGIPNLTVFGLENLAGEIEREKFDLSRVNFAKIFSEETELDHHQVCGVFSTLILGCTHYNFIKNEISDHFQPQRVLCGQDFTAQNIKNYLIKSKSLVKYKRFRLLFVGNSAKVNEKFYVSGGQRVVNWG